MYKLWFIQIRYGLYHMLENPNGRAIAQFGSTVASEAERVGKKPNEADLSYTAVCTGLSHMFISVASDATGRKRNERREA
jgi:hypothetical protein